MKVTLNRFFAVLAVILFFGVCLFPEMVTLDSKLDLSRTLELPTRDHPLGTDNLGRDLLVRLSEAIVETVLPVWGIGLLASLVGTGLGVSAVLLLGEGGLLFVSAVLAVASSLPVAIFVFMVSVVFDAMGLPVILFVLFFLFTVRISGAVLDFFLISRDLQFWQAHRSLGGTLAERLWRYGFGAEWAAALLAMTIFHLQIGVSIEAGLSYLGFGVQEPAASFGNILASHLDSVLQGGAFIPLLIVGFFWLVICFPVCFSPSVWFKGHRPHAELHR